MKILMLKGKKYFEEEIRNEYQLRTKNTKLFCPDKE
jgi:hypothetical protein